MPADEDDDCSAGLFSLDVLGLLMVITFDGKFLLGLNNLGVDEIVNLGSKRMLNIFFFLIQNSVEIMGTIKKCLCLEMQMVEVWKITCQWLSASDMLLGLNLGP